MGKSKMPPRAGDVKLNRPKSARREEAKEEKGENKKRNTFAPSFSLLFYYLSSLACRIYFNPSIALAAYHNVLPVISFLSSQGIASSVPHDLLTDFKLLTSGFFFCTEYFVHRFELSWRYPDINKSTRP